MNNDKNCILGITFNDEWEFEDLKSDLLEEFEQSLEAASGFFSARQSPVRFNLDQRANSAPSSPSRVSNVQNKIDKFESFIALNYPNKVKIMTYKKEIEILANSRNASKAWVTRTLNSLLIHKTESTLNDEVFEIKSESIKRYIKTIEEKETQIAAVYDANNVTPESSERKHSLDTTFNFIDNTLVSLSEMKVYLVKLKESAGVDPGTASNDSKAIAKAIRDSNSQFARIKLDCPVFMGNHNDKFDFVNWLAQYDTVMSANKNMSDCYKLSYLQSKAQGDAGKFIKHLELKDENYEVALELLKKHFLDIEYIRDELIKKILILKPEYDPEYNKTLQYLAEIKNIVNDLNRHYAADFSFNPPVNANPSIQTGGYYMLSQIVFSKLSIEMQKGLINESHSCYPTFDLIFDLSNKVINVINKTKKQKPNQTQAGTGSSSGKPSVNSNSVNNSTLNFSTNSNVNSNSVSNGAFVLHCRFCNLDGHSNLYCTTYDTYEKRKDRCLALGLCLQCTSLKHSTDDCYGKLNKLFNPCRFCKAHNHVGAMCQKRTSYSPKGSAITRVCLSTEVEDCSNFLLPVFTIVMEGPNGEPIKFNTLLDTCSSRTYISKKIANKLDLDKNKLNRVEYEVKTFLKSENKHFREATVQVNLPSGRYNVVPVLIDDDFDMDLKIRNLNIAISNIKNANLQLAAEYSEFSDTISIDGLVGVDILQYIGDMRVVKCLNGSAYQIATGLIPYGNISHFLFSHQIVTQNPAKIENNFRTIVSRAKCSPLHLNLALEPKATY